MTRTGDTEVKETRIDKEQIEGIAYLTEYKHVAYCNYDGIQGAT